MKKKRKKQHRIRKICLGLLLSCFCILVGAGVFFGIRGYGLYREATAEESLEERIEKVRSIEHFTRYSEMPRFYRQAVISVEDHRFWEHYGIDPIAVTRAVWTNLKTMSFAEGGPLRSSLPKTCCLRRIKGLSGRWRRCLRHLR